MDTIDGGEVWLQRASLHLAADAHLADLLARDPARARGTMHRLPVANLSSPSAKWIVAELMLGRVALHGSCRVLTVSS